MDNIRNKVKSAVKKAKQIAVAQAVGRVAERLQNYNDHTGVQYALACTYGKPDGFPSIFDAIFDDIAQRAAKDGYMSEKLINVRAFGAKSLLSISKLLHHMAMKN